MGPSVSAGAVVGQRGPGRHRARRPLVVVALVAALAAGLGALIVGPTMGSAAAPRRTCDQFGSRPCPATSTSSRTPLGRDHPQCITPFDTGFTVDVAQHVNNKGPAGYPSIYRGCNFGYCTVGSPFPAKVAKLGTVRSYWSTKGPTAGGTQQYNTAYDIWFDPTATNKGRTPAPR